MVTSVNEFVFCRIPKEGADFVLTVRKTSNISDILAKGLHAIYAKGTAEIGAPVIAYSPNEFYQFANGPQKGLVFRLFHSGLDNEEPTLEFYVPDAFKSYKMDLMLEIPGLMQKAGMQDKAALGKIGHGLMPFWQNTPLKNIYKNQGIT